MEEKQLEFVRALYGKYGITDESKVSYAAEAFKNDFDGALNAFYSKYNPDKEIDQDYFGQIKNSYFASVEPVTAVEQPVDAVSQEAPSGFWANFKNSMDNVPESVANGFWTALNFVDRGGHEIDKAVYDLTGINMKFDQSVDPSQAASPNTEAILGKIAQNQESMLPVKGITEEGATVPERIAGGIDATVQFARSIATGAVSMGALPMIEQYESMYLDAVETKAKELGVNPIQLILNNQDDDLEPMLYGVGAALLEKVGLKGVSKYINSMPKDTKSSVFKWLYANAKEGGTEWGQEVLSFVNEARAKGGSVEDALVEAMNRGFSREGAEVFASGFVGAAGIGAAGKGIKKILGGKDGADTIEAEEVDNTVTPEQQAAVDQKMAAAGAVVQAANSTVDTGDAEIDQLVQNTLRETEQALESKLLSEEQEKAKAEAQKSQEKEAKQKEVEFKKQETKQKAAQVKVDQAVAKDVSVSVKDKSTLKKAVYKFLGVTETKDNVEEVNGYVNFFDGIATARAKREGISKEEWYKSRVASIGTTQDAAKPVGTSFLEDGRAAIVALQSGSPREFFRGFAQVIQRDLDETESAALEAEFGINFKEDFSDESLETFGQAFESYLQTGKVPEGIKGNNASFVRAAFEKISNWLRDIKSSIEGESSLYVNSNVRKIFDSIVTGQEIKKEQTQEEIVDTSTEGEVKTDESLVGRTDVKEPVVGDESVGTGEVTTELTQEQDVIDLTEQQEVVEEETKQTVEDEQTTEKESDEGVLQAPKKPRVRPQADARERRRKAFEQAAKPFKAKADGGISSLGDFNKALKAVTDLQNDPEQDGLTKQEARQEMIRLMDIKSKADEIKKLRSEKKDKVYKIKSDAKKAGYSTSGVGSFFTKSSIVPLEYDNGEVHYFDVETGEKGSYSLSENKAKKFKSEDEWEKGANERLKKEETRTSERLIAENTKKESEERASIESSKKDSMDKESNKANSVYEKTINNEGTSKNIISLTNDVSSIDLDNAFSSKREGDVSLDKLRKSVKLFISDFLGDLKDFSSDKQMNSNKKKLSETRDALLNFAKNSPLLTEKDRTEILETIQSLEGLFDLESSERELVKEKKNEKKVIGNEDKTILSDKVNVQMVGFDSDYKSISKIGGKIRDLVSDFLRGFNLDRKIIVIDSDFFSNNNKEAFSGKSTDEIAEMRKKEISRVAMIMSKNQIYNPYGRLVKMSFESIHKMLTDAINKVNSSNANDKAEASTLVGEKYSFIVINSGSRDELINRDVVKHLTHELGHSLERDIFDNADQATKEAIEKEYKEWFHKKSKEKDFITTAAMGLPSYSKTRAFEEFGKTFREYFAEQVSYWANTQEKPKGVVEKFFGYVAESLKKLFSMYKEQYGVSTSITKLLNDQFSFDGSRASEKEMKARDEAVDYAASEQAKIMDSNRFLVDLNLAVDEKPNVLSSLKGDELASFMKDFFAKKKATRAKIVEVEASIEGNKKKIESAYDKYKANGGTMSLESFQKRVHSKAEELYSKKIMRDLNFGISKSDLRSKKEEEEDGDAETFESKALPAVDFSKNVNPRSGDKRKIFLDKITTAIDGKFNSISEFNKIIRQINKSLKSAGEPEISSAEKKKIFNGTKSGSIALITLPIERKLLRKKPTKSSVDLVKSFSASRKERDEALAVADDMVKTGNPLTAEQLDEFNRLQLVGLFNTTVAEREQLIKDKVGKAVADMELSRIAHRVADRSNSDRITIASAFYKSVMGFKKIAENTFKGALGNKTYEFQIFDRNKIFKKGDLVEYGSKLYRVKEPVDKFDTGFLSKMDMIGDFNTHKTNAELAIASKKKGFLSRMNESFLGTSGIESIANIVKERSEEGAFEGELSDMLGTYGFRQAAMNKRNHNFKVQDMYKELGERIFGVKGLTKVNKKIYDMKTTIRTVKYKDNDGNVIEKKMSVGEMMTWYAYMGQADLADRFRNMGEKYKNTPDSANFWNDSKRDAIIDSLKSEEKEFVKGVIQDVMPYVYETLNKAHKRELGYDLQLIDNYFPTFSEATETDSRQMSVIDTATEDFSTFLSTVSNRNIKERRSNSALIAKDFFGQFMQYSDKAFHYAEYVGPLKRASLLFQNQKYGYSGHMKNTFGNEIMRQIKINLDNIAFGGASRTVGMKHHIADTLRSLNIGGAFMANITMIPKQAASFIALADSMGWRNFSKYYITSDWKSRLNDMKEIHNMNFMKERLSQGGRLSYDTQGLMFNSLEKELSRTEAGKKSEAAIAFINKALFSPMMIGDASAVYIGGAPLLNDLKKKAKDKFPDDSAKQKEWVNLKFEEAVSRTQQSRDVMDQSDYQTAGSWAQWVVTFMSTPILYGRILAGAIRDVRKGIKRNDKALIKKGVKTGLMFSTIAPLFFQVASTGGELVMDSLGYGDDEEEDQLKAWEYNMAMIGVSFLQHIPIAYPTIQNYVDYIVKGDDFDLSLAAPMAISGRGLEAPKYIIDDIITGEFDFNDEETQRHINDITKAMGFNYKGLSSIAKNWKELFEEGSVEDWRLLLGYSEYAIE